MEFRFLESQCRSHTDLSPCRLPDRKTEGEQNSEILKDWNTDPWLIATNHKDLGNYPFFCFQQSVFSIKSLKQNVTADVLEENQNAQKVKNECLFLIEQDRRCAHRPALFGFKKNKTKTNKQTKKNCVSLDFNVLTTTQVHLRTRGR